MSCIAELLLPIYVSYNEQIDHALRWYIRSLISDLDIERIKIIRPGKRFTKIQVAGKEASVACKFLEKEFGKKRDIREISDGDTIPGRVYKSSSKNLLIDIGLEDLNNGFVYLDFNAFLEKIFKGKFKKIKIHFNEISPEDLGILKNFPLYVNIYLTNSEKIQGSATVDLINTYRRWIDSRLDILFVYGATRSQVEKAIKETGHLRDIKAVRRLAFLEHAVICRWRTSAKGLIPEIGPKLGRAKLAFFSPRTIVRQKSISRRQNRL